MSDLHFELEWEVPQGARGPELRAIWGRLRIVADGQLVTRIEDQAARSVRDAIYGPLYPVAEWIVTNWWSLLYEVASPTRIANGYGRRHDLGFASEGFALPRLQIRPEGRRVLVSWRRAPVPEGRVNFLSSGSVYVERDRLETALRSFVDTVVTRLANEGVTETLLAEDWSAIASADPEELEFCSAAGLLGRDPYAIEEKDSQALISAVRTLPPYLMSEFLAAVDRDQVVSQVAALDKFLRKARDVEVELEPLQVLRASSQLADWSTNGSRSSVIEVSDAPWEQGYRMARWLRGHLASATHRVESVKRLGEMLGVDGESWKRATDEKAGKLPFLDAAVAITRTGSPYFLVERRHPAAKTFSLSRAVCEYVAEPGENAALVTPTYSERQKRNRAFAAELIAPAEQLRTFVTAPVVAPEEVAELAAEFSTSEYVIRHQLENHGIARVSDDLAA